MEENKKEGKNIDFKNQDIKKAIDELLDICKTHEDQFKDPEKDNSMLVLYSENGKLSCNIYGSLRSIIGSVLSMAEDDDTLLHFLAKGILEMAMAKCDKKE